MTDQQLAAFFSKKKETFCGRFHSHQLQRELAVSSTFVPWVKPFIPLAISALTILFVACAPENKVLGEPVAQEILPNVDTFDSPGNVTVIVAKNLSSGDSPLPETKESDVQVVTKKDKTPHPAFVPVDTVQLPKTDTISTPGQTTDSLRKPLLHPRKEALIMGMVLYTQKKAVTEKNIKEEVAKEKQ